ncbi:MAG: HupE/UreJ family protein, partial [Pseudomonadota bacterium]
MNMSEMHAVVSPAGNLTLKMRMDLQRQLNGGEAYYALSQLGPAAASDSVYQSHWQSLLNAIEIEQAGALIAPQLLQVEPPQGYTREQFTSGFTWPMTEVTVSASVDPSLPLRIRFRSSFAFEEPIALTLEAEQQRRTRLLVPNQRSASFVAYPSGVSTANIEQGIAWKSLWSFTLQGALHVVPLGLDHLLFLLCMYLGAKNWRQLVWLVSLFTVAHSITLGIAAYRLVPVPTQWVEVLIVVSILWLAIGNLRNANRVSIKAPVILVFGLLHGLGFASALQALDIEPTGFLWTLLAFNVGVEIGQLGFIAALALVLGWALQQAWARQRVH